MRKDAIVEHMPMNEELLTSPEVGRLLDKSARTIQRMADLDQIPVAQKLPGPNGAYLFRRSDIEAYRDAQKAVAS